MAEMSNQRKRYYRDNLYLLMILLHLSAMLGVDFVPFYPQSICQARSSPLRFLSAYREWYITTMSDPYYNIETPGHFFDFLVYVELVVQFPLALYLVWNSLTHGTLSVADELAAVIYGATTGLCTAVVCHDMWHMGPELIDPEARWLLLYVAYMPYAVIPVLMTMDMSLRLLSRVDKPKKSKLR